jgi:hypothetical protein
VLAPLVPVALAPPEPPVVAVDVVAPVEVLAPAVPEPVDPGVFGESEEHPMVPTAADPTRATIEVRAKKFIVPGIFADAVRFGKVPHRNARAERPGPPPAAAELVASCNSVRRREIGATNIGS